MKISFFDFTLNFGGAPQGSLYLMKRLQDKGYECNIIDVFGVSEQYKAKSLEYNLNHFVLYSKSTNVTIGHSNQPLLRAFGFLKQASNFFIITLRLINYIRINKPDLVIVNNEKSLFFLHIAKLLLNFKILFYFRGEGTDTQLSPRLVKAIKTKVDYMVAHSKKAVDNLTRAGIPKNILGYIPNCIESNKFKTPEKSTGLPVSNKFKIMLTAARPVREKGHHIAIEALNKLKIEGYEIDLWLPGASPIGVDDSYINYLHNLIINYGLDNDVHFIGWRDNLVSDIVSCDLVILPSHTEGFPRSIIESMIHGVPVCATPVGGIPEAIKHMETGLLFEVDDIDGLKESIKLMISDKELYKSISTRAKDFSRSYFDPKNNTDSIISIIEKI